MKLTELTPDNIKSLGIEQLTLLHRGVHRGARGGGDYDLLMSSHKLLATELERKGVGHGTPLNMPKPSIHAIYLKSPHGTLIAEGKKRAIAKSHPIQGMQGKRIIVSKENGIGLAFGAATIGEPEQVTAEDFDKRFEEHRVTSKERNRWWPDADKLTLYPIINFIPYDPPRTVEVPDGTQTLMQNIKFTPDLLQMPSVTKIVPEEHSVTGAVTEREKVKQETKMPWKVFKRGNEWCVFKITEEDKPTGKTLGCHNSRPKAQAQVRALFAAESKQMISEAQSVINEVLDTPTLVSDVKIDVPTITGQMKAAEPNQTTCTCPNCKQVSDHEPGITCNEVECTKCGSMMRGGGKETDEAEKPLAPEVIQAIADIVHAKMEAEKVQEDVPVETVVEIELVPEPVEAKAGRRVRKDKLAKLKDLFQQLKDLIGWAAYEDAIPELVLPTAKAFKGRDGRTWLMLWTTNSYIDRDDEIFRIKAIEDYVKRYDNNPIKGEFQFWHIPGSKFGNIMWQAIVADRFLVQMGTFDDTPIGNAFKAFLTSHPNSHPNIAPTGWGASHGYNYIDTDRADGVYDWFNTVESSVLPMVYAANLHNPNPVILGGKEMDDKQTAALRVIGDEVGEDLVKYVTDVAARKKAELDEFVEHKSTETEVKADAETPATEIEATPTESEPEVTKGATEELQTNEEGTQGTKEIAEAVVAEVIKTLNLESLSDMPEMLQTQTKESAKVAGLVEELTKRVTELEQSDEKKLAQRMLRLPNFSQFRASRVSETVLTDDDKDLANAAPSRQGPVLPIPTRQQ